MTNETEIGSIYCHLAVPGLSHMSVDEDLDLDAIEELHDAVIRNNESAEMYRLTAEHDLIPALIAEVRRLREERDARVDLDAWRRLRISLGVTE